MPTVHEIDVRDEQNRVIHFRVQVGPGNQVSCWTTEVEGGTLTLPELFAACVQRKTR